RELIKNAIRIRKVLGGGMRQIGFMAAAGIYALDHHVERLAEDHRRAKEIGQTLRNQPYVKDVEPIETNIVIFYLQPEIDETTFLSQLEAKNIRISSMGQGKLRIVTHLDYTEEMHEYLMKQLSKFA